MSFRTSSSRKAIKMTDDKENFLPNRRRAVTASTAKRAGLSENASKDGARDKLVEMMLEEGSAQAQFEKLFEYDAKAMMHLPPEKATKIQVAKLEDDTKDLPNTSYQKLSIWTGFAKYVERASTPSCVRIVFEMMVELKIGSFFKKLYEEWAAFEMREGQIDQARRIFHSAVNNGAVKAENEEEAFNALLQQNQSLTDTDQTLILSTSEAEQNRSSRIVRSVVSVDDSNLSSRLGSRRKHVPISVSSSKKLPKALSLPVPSSSRLSKLGRAQRVVVSSQPERDPSDEDDIQALDEGISNEVGDTKGDDRVSSFELEHMKSHSGTSTDQESGKERLADRIGDVSYIKNWNPDQHINTLPRHDDRRREQKLDREDHNQAPTITFRNEKDFISATPFAPGKASSTANQSEESPTSTFYPENTNGGGKTRNSHSSDSDFSMGSSTSRHHTFQPQQYSSQGQGSDVSRAGGHSSESDSTVAIPSFHNFKESLMSPKNIFIVNQRPFLRLAVIGRGGSSKVFKVLGIGEVEPQIYALKRIKLQKTDHASISSFLNEIQLLERLKGNPNIISLVSSEVDLRKRVIYMVMEHGEIDLNSMLQQQRRAKGQSSRTGMVGNLNINFIRLTWMNMLEAVHAIHEERIVHGDLKPANFLFVKGKLKLIDFGIAKAISNDTTNIMRDTQVGTLNYMSPEAIIDTNSSLGSKPRIGAPGMKLKQGRASDIWSLGCILYQMVYGQTPFHDLKLIPKIQCITDPNYKIDFPPLEGSHLDVIEVVKQCLQFNPGNRPPIVGGSGQRGLLDHPFLNPQASISSCICQGIVPGKVRRLVENVLEHSDAIKQVQKSKPHRFDDIIEQLTSKLLTSSHKPTSAPSSSSSPSGSMETVDEGVAEDDTTQLEDYSDAE